jgi:hypothetical protein
MPESKPKLPQKSETINKAQIRSDQGSLPDQRMRADEGQHAEKEKNRITVHVHWVPIVLFPLCRQLR